MKTESSVRSLVAVSLLSRLNSNLCLPLIERCGGIEGFFLESEKALQALYQESGISPGLFDRQKALKEADLELSAIDKHGIRICSVEDTLYPELLRQCEDAPLVFYYKGTLKAHKKTKYLAVVGTRHSSVRCQEKVDAVIAGLSEMGHHPIVVSGLAYGIDATAHRACLKYGLRTFAVLGHGLHMIYPASHKTLAFSILEAEGAWISEFPCTASTHASNFLRRNRIIAGLCHATLIAESAVKGGAMSTARLALSYNRDVMAFPGRPEDPYSAGCNQLIKENIAALIENAIDVARLLNYRTKTVSPVQTELRFLSDEDKGTRILNLLNKNGDTDIDELAIAIDINGCELQALLLQLELEGKILALPGKRYALK